MLTIKQREKKTADVLEPVLNLELRTEHISILSRVMEYEKLFNSNAHVVEYFI